MIDLLADAAPVHAYVSLGRAYDKQRNFAAADAVFEAGCCKFPHDSRIAVDRCKTAANRKDWAEAAERWQSLVQALGDAAPVEAWTSLSKAYRRQGKFDLAEAAISEARLMLADDVSVAAESAEVAMARLDWPEAVRRWQRVIDEFPTRITPDMYLRISLAHRLHGDFAAARQSLELLRQVEYQLVLSGDGPISQIIDGRARAAEVGPLTDRVCVQLHLYHVNMFPMYVSRLNFIPRAFALMVSVPEHESASAWRDRFAAALPLASEVLIRPVKNSGRDVMPGDPPFVMTSSATISCCTSTPRRHRRTTEYCGTISCYTMSAVSRRAHWHIAIVRSSKRLGPVSPPTTVSK